MKHLAKIQIEFLKEAAKWDDLSLEDQKGYLTRHPKSKRKLTAKPKTDKIDPVEKDKEDIVNAANGTKVGIVPGFENLGDLSYLDTKVENIGMGRGKCLKVQSKTDPSRYFVLFPQGNNTYDINVRAGTIEKPDEKLGGTLYHYHNKFHTPEETKEVLKHWGLTKPETTKSEKSEKIEQKSVKKDFDTEKIKNGLKSLPFRGQYGDDDEPYVDKNYVEKGVRYLGNWIDREGEEDDDYPSWSNESTEKYTKQFKEWAARQSWFNPDTMRATVHTGEKSWAYFKIKKRDLKREKKYRSYLKDLVKYDLKVYNKEPIDENEKNKVKETGQQLLKTYGSMPSSVGYVLSKKKDGSYKIDKEKFEQLLTEWTQ
jgi:hypothetical protein